VDSVRLSGENEGVTLYLELLKLIDALDAAGAEYAVCGGLAVGLHGHARATTDIDLLVPEAELERVKQAVRRSASRFQRCPWPAVNRVIGSRYLVPDSLRARGHPAATLRGSRASCTLTGKKENCVRITSKGQVTIPQAIRERLGLLPETEVEFAVEGNAVRIIKSVEPDKRSRAEALSRAFAAPAA